MIRNASKRLYMIAWVAFLWLGIANSIRMLKTRIYHFPIPGKHNTRKSKRDAFFICVRRCGVVKFIGIYKCDHITEAQRNDIIYSVNNSLALVCNRLGTLWRVFVMCPQGKTNLSNVTPSDMTFGMMQTLRQMAINSLNAELLVRMPDCGVDTRPSVRGYVDLRNDPAR
jgi:hypothetical protein